MAAATCLNAGFKRFRHLADAELTEIPGIAEAPEEVRESVRELIRHADSAYSDPCYVGTGSQAAASVVG